MHSRPLVVAVLVYEQCNLSEVLDLAHQVTRAGDRVVYCGVTEQAVDQSGLCIQVSNQLRELDAAGLDALIVPGGDPGSIIENAEVHSFISRVDRGVVAGICGGVLLLAAAGVTAGRHITHNYRRPFASEDIEAFVQHFWTSSDVEQDPTVGVVVDKRLVTALPTAAVEFAAAVRNLIDR